MRKKFTPDSGTSLSRPSRRIISVAGIKCMRSHGITDFPDHNRVMGRVGFSISATLTLTSTLTTPVQSPRAACDSCRKFPRSEIGAEVINQAGVPGVGPLPEVSQVSDVPPARQVSMRLSIGSSSTMYLQKGAVVRMEAQQESRRPGARVLLPGSGAQSQTPRDEPDGGAVQRLAGQRAEIRLNGLRDIHSCHCRSAPKALESYVEPGPRSHSWHHPANVTSEKSNPYPKGRPG